MLGRVGRLLKLRLRFYGAKRSFKCEFVSLHSACRHSCGVVTPRPCGDVKANGGTGGIARARGLQAGTAERCELFRTDAQTSPHQQP